MEPRASAPVANPIEENGTDYLRTHRIADLFQNLSASLVYHRPGKSTKDASRGRHLEHLDDPKAFMIDHLEQLKKARLSGVAFPSLVQDTDLTSAFRLLDPVGKGFITYSQYASSTLAVLGMPVDLVSFHSHGIARCCRLRTIAGRQRRGSNLTRNIL